MYLKNAGITFEVFYVRQCRSYLEALEAIASGPALKGPREAGRKIQKYYKLKQYSRGPSKID